MLGRIDMKKHMNTITTLLALSASVIIFGCEPKGDTSTEVKAPAETPATVAAKPEAKATEEKPKAPKATDATAKPSLLPAAPEDKLRKGEKTNAAATPKIPASLSSSKANKTNKLNQQPTEPVALKDQVIVAIPETLDLGTFSTSEKGSGSVSLKNNGNEPVTITRAKASCGCTTSDFKNGTVLQPGESTDISVTMNGKGRARKMSKTVTFTIDGYPALRLHYQLRARGTFACRQSSETPRRHCHVNRTDYRQARPMAYLGHPQRLCQRKVYRPEKT